jgi:predicted transcriptional regulator
MVSFNLGPLEQELMDYLWKKENVSVKEVHNHLKNRRKIAYTTVMTLMSRLTEKGFLVRRLEKHSYLYTARKSKEQTAKQVIKNIVDSLIDQYGKEAVAAFTDELKKRK